MDHSAGKEIENVSDPTKFDVRTVDTVHRYFSWICLRVLYEERAVTTSAAGADWFCQRCDDSGVDMEFDHTGFGAVGEVWKICFPASCDRILAGHAFFADARPYCAAPSYERLAGGGTEEQADQNNNDGFGGNSSQYT